MSDHESDVEVNENELTPAVVTKYQVAGDISNRALATVLAAVKPGASVLSLCQLGDSTILSLSSSVYKGLTKGIAFPTCVSPAQYVCHLSPLESDKEANVVLKDGDVVRVELGVHVDGYISQVSSTTVVGSSPSNPVTGSKANVIKAANVCAEAALRMIKPGNTNYDVTEVIEKVTKEYEVKPVEGMTSYQNLRNVLEGPKQIVSNAAEQQKPPKVTFELGEVYTVDIMVTSADGKVKGSECRTTIYKRNADTTYSLKMKASRAVFSQIQKWGTMAFNLRQLEEKVARMGIIECTSHGLVNPYGVMETEGEAAHVVFTILLMKNGALKLAGSFDEASVKSDVELKDEGLIELLKQPVRTTKKKKAKKASA